MVYAKYDGTDKLYRDKEELFKKTGITIPDPILPPKKLICLKGTLSEFKSIFCYAPLMGSAYMSEEQKEKRKNQLRRGAAAAMLNGNSTIALAGLAHADGQNRHDYTAAQYFTAKLNDLIELRGWLGFYKFCDGDEVEIVAEAHEDHYEVYAMLKPAEQIICIIPPCTSGHKYLFKDYLGAAFIIYISFTAVMVALFGSFTVKTIVGVSIGIGILFGFASIMAFIDIRTTFMSLAEQIFTALGWQNVEYINLRTMTRDHINQLIKENKYSLEWDPLIDSWIRPAKIKSKKIKGIYYYQPEVVFKKNPPKESKSKNRR